MIDRPFQRRGSESNAQVGRDFESKARLFWANQGMRLQDGISIDIGINGRKAHRFDLGDPLGKVIVECKAHTWTESGNMPSAKMTTWNEAMFLFLAAPAGYRKILFVLKDFREKRGETLGHYYVRINSHLIPKDVEIWEYDEASAIAEKIHPGT